MVICVVIAIGGAIDCCVVGAIVVAATNVGSYRALRPAMSSSDSLSEVVLT